MNFLIFVEEQEREEARIEDFKATMLTAFPSKSLYQDLYTDEEEVIVETIPQNWEEIRDIVDLINRTQFGDEVEIPYG